jgi:hypothetical protein
MAGDKRRVEVPIEALAALISFAQARMIDDETYWNNNAYRATRKAEFQQKIDALGEGWKKESGNG